MARGRARTVGVALGAVGALLLAWALRPKRDDVARDGATDDATDVATGPASPPRTPDGALSPAPARPEAVAPDVGSAPSRSQGPPRPPTVEPSERPTATSVVGVVVDDDGPVAGARVLLDVTRPGYRLGAGHGLTTDAHGRFAIDGPWGDRPSVFLVTAQAPGRFADAVRAEPGFPVIVRMQRAGAADVVVVDDASGAPVAGVRVQRVTSRWAPPAATLRAFLGDRAYGIGKLEATEARTGVDGRAHLDGPFGAAQVVVEARGRDRVVASVDFDDGTRPATEVRLGPAALRVRYVGVLRDDEGRPIAGAVLRSPDDPTADGALTGPDGAFALEEAPLGLVLAPLVLPDGSRAHAKLGRLSDLERDAQIRVSARVEWPSGRWCTGVVLRDDRPLEGAVLSSGCEEDPTEQARTDAEGRFRLPVVEGCRVEVETPDGLRWPVTVAPQPDLVLRVPPSARVRGTVTDRALAPIAGARVGDGRAAYALTDDAGRFSLVVAAGSVRLYASCPGYAWASTPPWTVPAGTTADRDVRLEPGGTVTGRVVGPEGAPVAEATVVVRGAGGIRGEGTVETRPDGTFVATGVAGPPFTVTVTERRFVTATVEDVEADVALPTIVLRRRER